jgi:hypothetical protein
MVRVMTHRSRLVALLSLALIGGAVLRLQADRPAAVFTVAQVQRGLATQPHQWINRTVLVRGVFRYMMSDAGVIDIFHPPPGILVTYALYQPGPSRLGGISGGPLVLKLAPHLAGPRPNPLAALLRQVPWLQGLLGGPSANAPVFRITLLAPARGLCAVQACAAGQLDEQPW